MTHPVRRTEAALQLAEEYADAHRNYEGVTNREGGIMLMLVSLVMSSSERAWDECLDAIENNELNTAQARQGNPYRKAKS